jgi:hypothetical protein
MRGISRETNLLNLGLKGGSSDGAKAMERKLVMKLGECSYVVLYVPSLDAATNIS